MFAAHKRHVIVVGRTAAKAEKVAEAIRQHGHGATAFAVDATKEEEVIRLFDAAMHDEDFSAPADLVVNNAGNNIKLDVPETEVAKFEAFWRVNTLGGFIVGREAAHRFVPQGYGTVLFTGASGSLRGMLGFAHFAASKAGLRMISQSMAREYGRLGIHVTHVIIDGGIDGERVRKLFPGIEAHLGETAYSISMRSQKTNGIYTANIHPPGRRSSICDPSKRIFSHPLGEYYETRWSLDVRLHAPGRNHT